MRLARTAAARPLMASGFSNSEDPEVKRGERANRQCGEPEASPMTSSGWPFFGAQCPQCSYFERPGHPRRAKAGEETVGYCRHPRIEANLFQPRRPARGSMLWCRLFLPSSRADGSARARR
jgi:hypothetical protein